MSTFFAQFLEPWPIITFTTTITVTVLWRRYRAKRERDHHINTFVRTKLAKALTGEEWGITWSHYVMPGGFQIGWNVMANVYQKYIMSLPIQKRHEIVDKLLDNQMMKYRQDYDEPVAPPDLATLVGMMNMVEVETMLSTVSETLDIDWVDRKIHSYGSNDLANDIVAFRFRHPY